MKRKYLTSTYLRDVDKYEIKLFLAEDDLYVSVKKLISVRVPFIIRDNLCVMDDGYYILEVVPKNENYSMRLFLDSDKKPLEYYFDINKFNGFDEVLKIPFCDDLYMDITYYNGEIKILDEDELIDAYNQGDVLPEDYEMAYKLRDKLLEEIKNGTNKLFNIDYNKYLKDF